MCTCSMRPFPGILGDIKHFLACASLTDLVEFLALSKYLTLKTKTTKKAPSIIPAGVFTRVKVQMSNSGYSPMETEGAGRNGTRDKLKEKSIREKWDRLLQFPSQQTCRRWKTRVHFLLTSPWAHRLLGCDNIKIRIWGKYFMGIAHDAGGKKLLHCSFQT